MLNKIKLFFYYLVTNPVYVVKYFIFLAKKYSSPFRKIKTPYGFFINLDLRRGVDGEIYFNRLEEYLSNFYTTYLKSDSVFLDIGSNIWFFSLLASTKIKEGKIYAIDADPLMAQEVEKNITINNITTITAINTGVSDHEGWMDFYVAKDPAFSSFSELNPKICELKEIKNIKISTLDSIVEENKISHIDFMKIDIEGGELDCLHWATNILKNLKPTISIEICDNTLSQYNKKPMDIFNYMSSQGYKIFNFHSGVLMEEQLKESYEYENLIFIHTNNLEKFWLQK